MAVSDRDLKIGTEAAYMQACKSLSEGGVPVGAALLLDGAVISVGHNRRVQSGSNILHGETDCIERAGHRFDLTRSVLFTTLAPCTMCAGAVRLFQIPVLVVLDAENVGDFVTGLPELEAGGVQIIDAPHPPTIEMMRRFQSDPETRAIWMGDIGK